MDKPQRLVLFLFVLCLGCASLPAADDLFADDDDDEAPNEEGLPWEWGDEAGEAPAAEGGAGAGDEAVEEDEDREPPAGDGDDAEGDGEDAGDERRITNEGFLRAVATYCEQHGVARETFGTGQFRLLRVGDARIAEPEPLLAAGLQALRGLEAWTGRNGVFLPGEVDEATCNYLVVIADRHFDSFVDFTREHGAEAPDGEDLVKKLRTYGGHRCKMLAASKFNAHRIMPAHWAVNSSASLALHAWFAATGERPPAWIAEGLKAELERVICSDGTPRITTIAYEDNRPDTGSNNWAQDVAELIRQESKLLVAANSLMHYDLIGMSGAAYKQMWSFCTYVRLLCGKDRGQRNRFYRLLLRLRAGDQGHQAIEQVLGKTDPGLTRGWLRWAVRQR